MSDHEIETSLSLFVLFEEVARQIRAVADPLLQQLAHVCELMREVKNEQVNWRHEETTSSRTPGLPSGSGVQSGTHSYQVVNLAFSTFMFHSGMIHKLL